MKTFPLHLTLFAVFLSLLVSAASAQNTKTQDQPIRIQLKHSHETTTQWLQRNQHAMRAVDPTVALIKPDPNPAARDEDTDSTFLSFDDTSILDGSMAGGFSLGGGVISGPLGPGGPSPSGPSADPNSPWDWTDPAPQPMYVHGWAAPVYDELPYFNSVGPASVLATVNPDIDYLDGWHLVYKDFGGPGAEGSVSWPWFWLHNKQRGLSHIFFWPTTLQEGYDHALVRLTQENGKEMPIFTFNQNITPGAPGDTPDNSVIGSNFLDFFDDANNEFVGITKIANQQWCHVAVPFTGYVPPADATWDAKINIEITGIDESNFQATGELALDAITSETTASGAMAAGGAVLAGIENFFGGWPDLKDRMDERANADDTWWESLLGNIQTMTPDLLGVAVGFGKSMLLNGAEDVPQILGYEGELAFEGTLTSSDFSYNISIFIPGCNLTNPSHPLAPEYQKPLGILALDRPNVEIVWDYIATWRMCWTSLTDPQLPLYLNPDLDGTVDVEAGFVNRFGETKFHSLAEFPNVGFFGEHFGSPDLAEYWFWNVDDNDEVIYLDAHRPGSIAVKLTITPPITAPNQEPVILVNSYGGSVTSRRN